MLKFATILAVLAFSAHAFAQVPIQQSAVRADAATFMASTPAPATACATINTTVANGTVTMNPAAGQFVWITEVEIDTFADGTGNTTSAVYTWGGITNPNGTAPVIALSNIAAQTNQEGTTHYTVTYNPPLRSSTAGTAVTLTPSAQLSHMILCPRVLGYFN